MINFYLYMYVKIIVFKRFVFKVIEKYNMERRIVFFLEIFFMMIFFYWISIVVCEYVCICVIILVLLIYYVLLYLIKENLYYN